VSSQNRVAVLDIDGVLADVRHRLSYVEQRPKDWDAFFAAAVNDSLLPEGLEVALDLADRFTIVYLTGRPERCRADTKAWLDKYRFPAGQLIMRRDNDRRPARSTKLDELQKLGGPTRVAILVDDDQRVIGAAEAKGYLVRHATWMHSEHHEQHTLFDAQESEGRS